MNQLNPVDILLVEDNPRDAELTIRTLKKHELANRLIHVEDGAEALDFIFSRGKFAEEGLQYPKVVFLDIKLPKVNGLEVLRALKNDQHTNTIPVVIITSSQEDPDLKTAYALGANSYVVKPVAFEDFQEIMRQLGYYWLLVNKALG
ncbi:MAG TPA: response regulator [Anaerolineales bacterium]|nr:response regulator [Anaerolineales bacterium]